MIAYPIRPIITSFKFMKINNSSAIANVDFSDNNKVLVQFTTNDTPYEFLAKDSSSVRSGLELSLIHI